MTCKIGLLIVHRGPATMHAMNRNGVFKEVAFHLLDFLIFRKLSAWCPKPDLISVTMAQSGTRQN